MRKYNLATHKIVARTCYVLSGFLLFICLVSKAGEVELVSHSEDGVPLLHGAAWLYGLPVQAPVNDAGDVAFIAPMPEHEDSPDAQFHASYLTTATGLTMLLSGLDPFAAQMGTQLRVTNARLAGDGQLKTFAILTDERVGSTSGTTVMRLNIQTFPLQPELFSVLLGHSPDMRAADCDITLAPAGNSLLLHGGNVMPTLFAIANNMATTSTELTNTAVATGSSFAMTENGEQIFFAASLPGYGLLTGQNGIFCYRPDNDLLTFVCAAGGVSLAPELKVSADGKVVVFRRLTGALATAEYQDGVWQCSDNYPIQASVCRRPAISANGRFVAYEGRQSTAGPTQVYRYDRWRGLSELVSVNALGQAADSDCLVPAISPDGQQVSFVSAASNLPDGTLNGNHHVFRRELPSPQVAENWLALTLEKGWNLISIPFSPDQESSQRLLTCCNGNAWTWKADKQSFSRWSGEIAPGQGMWLYVAADEVVNVTGIVTNVPVKTNPGWHLIGPGEVKEKPTLPEDILTTRNREAFAWRAVEKTFSRVTENDLEYGKAYWIFKSHD